MPPQPRISKEMIVEKAFDIARTEGADKITARRISESLMCSTQPVLYYFSTVGEIRQAVYQRADAYHTAYLMRTVDNSEDPIREIGMNYIRFAAGERHLFRLLFQSDAFSGLGLWELAQSEALEPVFQILRQKLGMGNEKIKEIFSMLFIFVHGYASLLANNEMIYDEPQAMDFLTKAFRGAVHNAKEENNDQAVS